MPRTARLDLPGHFYHVIVRGVERRSIFSTGEDKTDFLGRLAKGLQETSSQCFAWALMTNHLHLLILAGANGLAALMHPLLTGYVGSFNRRYKRVGHLVQNRFKAILCEADTYFLELVRYIHLNPVRAKMITTLDDLSRYPWTGHTALLGHISLPWQAVNATLEYFGSTVDQARKAYVHHLLDGWNQGERPELEGGGLLKSTQITGESLKKGERPAFDARILGSGDFVNQILAQSDLRDQMRQKLQQQQITLHQLEQIAAQSTGAEVASLFRRDRTKSTSAARAMVIYAATDLLGHSGKELEQRLKVSSSGISAARRRGRVLAKKYRLADLLTLPSNSIKRDGSY